MMRHSPYPVVLDACVLYPARLRDLLMHLGIVGLYQPKWTPCIQNEWCRNLLHNRPDIKPEALEAVRRQCQSLRHPPLTAHEFIEMLLRQGLPVTVKALEKYQYAI